jgi:tetratricopeptide (TPR) repeat protein
LLLARGKAEEAEPKLRASLDEIHRVLGREYEFSLCKTFALTDSLVRQGKWSQAESLLREQVEIRRPLRGRRIDSTLKLISKLADVLCDQGSDQHKLAEAESLYREALKLTDDLPSPYLPPYILGVFRQTKARGTGGPIALKVARSRLLEGLGLCRLARGDAEEAERLIRQSLDSRRSFLLETHVEIGESLSLLGAALTEDGRAEQAESLLREGLGILRKALPAGHWRLAATDGFLGACLAAQGRFPEAEPLVLAGYRTLEADRHAPPLMVSLALERVIRLYDAWGKPEKAAEWRARRPADGHRRP